ncbi:DUF2726 domain-containing protein [Qipengyuania sphaerica]|uniref:DUF2726 domain-containing protein n=1 Tax=Qipengyuania sphaerica TaxID=2867243 RepID=UPI001C86DC04|nr:DUF2726 domain-containing protein [Qipengyuania sphaerica]MBX7539573.1 DUF2726 domain-containing protein [Qipengyuania sphaerica]
MFETLFEGAINSQVVFVAVLVAVVFFVTEWRKAGRKKGSGKRYYKNRQPNRRFGKTGEASKLATAADQLETVMAADFKPRSLLNKSEANVFRALDQAVIARNPGWQVMAQVSLGEFLSSRDQSAFGCVNSKRVDFALMDENCYVQHALEYQGKGHHQGSAAARDAVKKEALRKAGIGYHEIVAGHTTPSELRTLVEKLVPAE